MRVVYVVVLLLLIPPVALADEVELTLMNGVYTDLDSDLRPVERGAMTIHISSPEHQLTVHGNRLRLTRSDDGTLEAEFEVDFEGQGKIHAELVTGNVTKPLDDDVTVPRQNVAVAGRIRMEAVDTGYLITLVERPPTVELRIESGFAKSLLDLCQLLARMLPVGCSGLAASLSVVTVPLPEPGTQLFLAAERLTDAERAWFDRFTP